MLYLRFWLHVKFLFQTGKSRIASTRKSLTARLSSLRALPWEELVAMLALGVLLAEQSLVPAALALVGTLALTRKLDTGVSTPLEPVAKLTEDSL